eukprot:7072866-Pyramimonas_sp.AAC.1
MFRGRLFKFTSVRKASTTDDKKVDDAPKIRGWSVADGQLSRSSLPRSPTSLHRSITNPPMLANMKLLSVGDTYNAFKAGGGKLELKDFALRFKIAPTNIWLKSF